MSEIDYGERKNGTELRDSYKSYNTCLIGILESD